LAFEGKFRVIFYRGTAQCQTWPATSLSCELNLASNKAPTGSFMSREGQSVMKGLAEGQRTKHSDETTHHLRRLAHDLSNSLETIVQGAYLLEQAKLDEKARKWTKLIDTAAKDAVRLNRQIREILKSQS